VTGISWRLDDHSARVAAQVHRAAMGALSDGGHMLLGEANKTVPIEEGTLARSGSVSEDGQGTVAVGYDTPYAVIQHERVDFRHDAGRRAKWLQLAFQENAHRVWNHIAGRIRAVTR
jgi:hypothetical protein